MDTKIEDKVKLIILGLVFFIALLAVIIAYIVFNGYSFEVNNESNQETSDIRQDILEDISLERYEIVYGDEISRLTSKITNNGAIKQNIRFKAKLVSNDGSIISETIVYVGKLKTSETKYIDSYLTIDISKLRSIIYEVIK